MSSETVRIPAIDRPPAWQGVAGLVVTLPSTLFVILNILRFEMGVREPYETLRPVVSPSTEWGNAILAAVAILGPVVGFVLAMWSVFRAALRRDDGWLVATFRLRLWWPHLAVALVALTTAAILNGHLAIEAIHERWP
jgi:hypothetical protein